MSDMEKLVETAAQQAQATNNYDTVGLFLFQKGYSAAGAAGVRGCIAGESGGDPEAVQFPSGPESGGAGLIQWTPASSRSSMVAPVLLPVLVTIRRQWICRTR